MSHTIFNNPEIVAKGWYIVCPSRALPSGSVQSFTLCGQRVAVFRGEDGKIRALDAYCPHMGTDLGIGSVHGNQVRCFFHHWAFDGEGQCQDIPCQDHIPPGATLPSYATEEKYGFVWIYPDRAAPTIVAEFDELKGQELAVVADQPLTRKCHHHICMINGIDVQHLQTVHHLSVDLELSLQQEGEQIDFTLSGEFLNTNWRERLGRAILGPRYAYSMRYAHGCLGLLTMMKEVRWIPQLYMIYAYRPIGSEETGSRETFIQPIYVTKKRPGLLGWVITHLLLWLTRLSYYALRGEDGMIYDNIRFSTERLLPVDAPIAHYVRYVNGLEPSRWSQAPLPKSVSLGRGALTVPPKLPGQKKVSSFSPSPRGEGAGSPPERSRRG
ncbi:rieske (2fe-2s) domain-containing protein [Leptolyngbya sp. Heron Island J]|uniref:aromatic ring-hydroxylating oxygenase subunit alpha n=1 Tax=Leptolyngbya sp. Heron Island J TaxID=1385935 RepID=UPI0003B9877D|nr:aromatic ring-hydroxylating dioxygenase subunit alpha [Leptolyngbya sp. Heron Island J]ESA35273.1 rieske (2fe-2s) domain-containing protein [Leptolyngbya sp. Heron Island J]